MHSLEDVRLLRECFVIVDCNWSVCRDGRFVGLVMIARLITEHCGLFIQFMEFTFTMDSVLSHRKRSISFFQCAAECFVQSVILNSQEKTTEDYHITTMCRTNPSASVFGFISGIVYYTQWFDDGEQHHPRQSQTNRCNFLRISLLLGSSMVVHM